MFFHLFTYYFHKWTGPITSLFSVCLFFLAVSIFLLFLFCLFVFQNRKTALHITINITPTPITRIKCVGKGKVILWKLFPWGLKNFQDTIIQSIIQQSLRAGRPILETKRNFYDTSLPAATHSAQTIEKDLYRNAYMTSPKSSSGLLCQPLGKLWEGKVWSRYLFCLFLIYKILSIWLFPRSDFIFLSISHRSRLSVFWKAATCIHKIFFYIFINTHKGNITALPIFLCLSVLWHYTFKILEGFYNNFPEHCFNFCSWYSWAQYGRY